MNAIVIELDDNFSFKVDLDLNKADSCGIYLSTNSLFATTIMREIMPTIQRLGAKTKPAMFNGTVVPCFEDFRFCLFMEFNEETIEDVDNIDFNLYNAIEFLENVLSWAYENTEIEQTLMSIEKEAIHDIEDGQSIKWKFDEQSSILHCHVEGWEKMCESLKDEFKISYAISLLKNSCIALGTGNDKDDDSWTMIESETGLSHRCAGKISRKMIEGISNVFTDTILSGETDTSIFEVLSSAKIQWVCSIKPICWK